MARRRPTRSKTPKLDQAKRIVVSMTSRGAQPSNIVRAAVARKGISMRTYRTARKQVRAVALRKSRHSGRRGAGRWYVKKR